jgi:hypothetical protein
MQKLTIDLKKNTKVADLVADLEPGESIFAELSIVSKDEQSLVVEIDAVGDTPGDLDGDDEADDDGDEMPMEKKPEAKKEKGEEEEGGGY